MSKEIPVIIVDDEHVDRVIVQRRLERSENQSSFTPISEYEAGDTFLEANVRNQTWLGPSNPLILMDINMPGLSGFETVDMFSKVMSSSGQHAVVVMFTSSENPVDQAAAEERRIVKGLIAKPLDEDAITRLVKLYETHMTKVH